MSPLLPHLAFAFAEEFRDFIFREDRQRGYRAIGATHLHGALAFLDHSSYYAARDVGI